MNEFVDIVLCIWCWVVMGSFFVIGGGMVGYGGELKRVLGGVYVRVGAV